MLSKSHCTKLRRKSKRCQAIVKDDTGICPSEEEATEFIGICNAGLSTGLSSETLLQEALQYGKVEDVVMIPKKSYCFIRCYDKENALHIYHGMHGISKLAQNNNPLYLSFFQALPTISNTRNQSLPSGLILLKDFVTVTEETQILEAVLVQSRNNDITAGTLKHREVFHYGYEFLYGRNNVDESCPLKNGIPMELNFLWDRLKNKVSDLDWYSPDQLTINRYNAGQGIPPHVDTHSAFLDPIISLSLESDIVMEFRRRDSHVSLLLPRRSLLVMSKESRYGWTHGITPRHMDVVTASGGLDISRRSQRTSLTVRKLRRGPCCNCSFPEECDSRKVEIGNNKISNLEPVAAKLEQENVHKVYDEIANHFSETRHTPWAKVQSFLLSFEPGDVVVDIGCGNGKYLDVISSTAKIGCDRSEGLLKVCKSRNFNVFKCDCLAVPIRNNSVSGCISIAVIHHLATEDRRKQAICEMVRILQPKGRALIYVWAKNQEANNEKSSYLRQNKKKNQTGPTDEFLTKSRSDIGHYTNQLVDLPIHKNRTQFAQQDVFVPWKLKSTESDKTFLRYYHVFEENELEKICKSVGGVHVEESYYDQGNWCVILNKI